MYQVLTSGLGALCCVCLYNKHRIVIGRTDDLRLSQNQYLVCLDEISPESSVV